MQHDICRILSGLYYTGTNTLITVYLQCDLQTINACNNRNPNLSSLLRLTHDGYVRTNIPPSQTRYVVQSSAYRALTHVFSATPSKVLLYHICDKTRRQTVGSSYPRVKQAILFACRRAPVHKERPYHRSTFVYTNFSIVKSCSQCCTSTERPQPVTLVQPSNRLGCDKVSFTEVFHSLAQANIISETADDPCYTKVQTSTRHLGDIAIFPTLCGIGARRQLLMFPPSTACIATDSNAQLSQHDIVLIALKPTTRGISVSYTHLTLPTTPYV